MDSGLERLGIAGKAGDRVVAVRYAGIAFGQKLFPFRDDFLECRVLLVELPECLLMRRGRRGLVVRCYVDSGLERLSIAGKAGDRGVALRYAGIVFVQKPFPFRDDFLQ